MDGERLKKRLTELSAIALFVTIIVLIAILMHPSEKVMGILQMDSYQYEESEKRLLESHEKDPKDLVTIKSLIQLYYRWGKKDAHYEINYYKKYIALSPNDTEMRKELARTYSWEKMPDKALEQYEAILEYEPNNIEILRSLAATYAWAQNHQKAINCLLTVFNHDKFNEVDFRNLVRYYISSDMGQKGLEEAIKYSYIHRRNFRNQFTSDDYINLAYLNLWLGKKDRSLEILDSMIRHYPRNVDVKMTCIEWLLEIDESELVSQKLKKWLDRTPDNLLLLENYVDIYLKIPGQEEKALEILEAIMKHPEGKDEHHLQYYWLLVDKKSFAKAYEKGITFSDKFKDTHNLWTSLASVSFESQLYEESLAIWNKIKKENLNNAEARENIFSILVLLNRKKESIIELFWLLEKFPNNQEYILHALNYYIEKKDYDSVFKWANKGISIDPDNLYFSNTLIDCAKQRADKSLAIDLLNKMIVQYPKNINYLESLLDIYLKQKNNIKAIDTINLLWKNFSIKKEQAEKITLMYSWVSAYKEQLNCYIDLEKREAGYQYWDVIIKTAQYAKKIDFARAVLEKKIFTEEGFTLKDVEQLISLYRLKDLTELELKLLNHKNILNVIPNIDLLKRKAKIYESLGETKSYLTVMMNLYDNHETKNNNLRIDILKKVTWISDNEFKKVVYEKYAPNSLEYANMLLDEKSIDKALVILKQFNGTNKENQMAHELILNCEFEKNNKSGILKELSYLISNGEDQNKNSGYLSQRASLNHELGKINEALTDALEAIKKNPNNKQAQVVKGYALYDLKKYPEAAEALKKSESKETYPRFLRGAALYRFTSGHREGVRVFNELLREYREKHTFYKWDLVLNIGYEMNSPYLKERAFYYLTTEFCKDDKSFEQIMPRYALHLLYTGRRIKAEKVYKTLKVTEKPNYIACQRIFEPEKYKGNLSVNEKLALADYSDRSGDWFQATLWLP